MGRGEWVRGGLQDGAKECIEGRWDSWEGCFVAEPGELALCVVASGFGNGLDTGFPGEGAVEKLGDLFEADCHGCCVSNVPTEGGDLCHGALIEHGLSACMDAISEEVTLRQDEHPRRVRGADECGNFLFLPVRAVVAESASGDKADLQCADDPTWVLAVNALSGDGVEVLELSKEIVEGPCLELGAEGGVGGRRGDAGAKKGGKVEAVATNHEGTPAPGANIPDGPPGKLGVIRGIHLAGWIHAANEVMWDA